MLLRRLFRFTRRGRRHVRPPPRSPTREAVAAAARGDRVGAAADGNARAASSAAADRAAYERATATHFDPPRILQHLTGHRADPARPALVTVIVVCFNYGRFIGAAIDSLKAQTLPPDEIIVIDGSSTDPATIDEYGRLKRRWPDLDIYLLGDRPSIGQNRLFGLTRATGTYVCFMDADDLFAPTYLEKAVLALEAGRATVASSYVRLFHDKDVAAGTRLRAPDGMVWQTGGVSDPEMFTTNRCPVSSVFRHDFWLSNAIGHSVDHDLNGIEDWDFWCRFAIRNATGVVVREPLHLHRLHGASVTDKVSDSDRKAVALRKAWSFAKRHLEGHPPARPAHPPTPAERLSGRASPVDVLFLLRSFDGGEVHRLLAWLAPFLDAAGLKTAFASTSRDETASDGQDRFGVMAAPVVEARTICDDAARAQEIVRMLALLHRPRIIVNCGADLLYGELPFLREANPGAVFVDYFFDAVARLPDRLKAGRLIDLDLAASMAVAEALRDHGIDRGRIAIVPPGVPVPKVPSARASGASGEPAVFGLVARDGEEGREADAIEVVQRLARSGSPAQLTIARAGIAKPELPAAERRGSLVQVIPWQEPSGSAAFFREIDCLLDFTDSRTLPLLPLQALGHGIALIAAARGAGAAIADASGAGLLSAGDGIDGLEAAARRFIALSAAERIEMGRRGREHVLRNHSIESCAARHVAVFADALRGGSPG